MIYKICVQLPLRCPVPSTGDGANHALLGDSTEFKAPNALATFLLQGFQ